jgi:hypothetical protein
MKALKADQLSGKHKTAFTSPLKKRLTHQTRGRFKSLESPRGIGAVVIRACPQNKLLEEVTACRDPDYRLPYWSYVLTKVTDRARDRFS